MQVNIHEAKTNFSKLLQRVAAGEEITISRAGKPVAKLVACVSEKTSRPLGFLKDKIWVADDFDAPLPDDLLALFEGEPDRKKPGRAKPVKNPKKRARS